jgi:hypothetical protein
MNMEALSDVAFGDNEGLQRFMFENGLQHRLFRDTFFQNGFAVPAFPLMDPDVSNLDDWMLTHQVEHQSFAGLLGLSNPFNMLDADLGKQEQFYDWLATHLTIHEQIAANLGLV